MEEKETAGAARHAPTHDAASINRAIEKAANDPNFIDYAVNQLKGLRFPAFKDGILDYAKKINADRDVISLLESLNGYMEFRDEYHVLKSLRENSAAKKKEYQLTDKTRQSPDVRTRPTTADKSIKEREAANVREERKDYPEVTPTAMSNFVCDRCGKPFQNQQDLAQHRQYESGTAVT
ncbi:MAG TPA: DUF2795 domain-containing protein [Nitrososphaera sp.]|jgi:hypothetical protein|nr:DUF2795 domain-containing protein [Nitrososphaera sp.]